MAFHCTVLTPERQAFDGQVEQAIVAAHDGALGVLTNRAPMLVRLGIGALRLDRNDGSRTFFLIEQGVAQMKDNVLTILTSRATPAAQIDFQMADAEFAAASALPVTDSASLELRERRLALARAMRALAGK